jgi:hypothetical protein
MLNQSTRYSDRLATLRAGLLEHSVYSEVDSVADLRRFMEDHVFAVWDFMSLLKRLQQDLTCTKVPWFPVDNTRAARLINDIVAGEETDVDPDGSYVSHLDLYLRAMADVGASTSQFDAFRSLARIGASVEAAMVRTDVPSHVQAFVTHTMALAGYVPQASKDGRRRESQQRSLASFHLLHRTPYRTRWRQSRSNGTGAARRSGRGLAAEARTGSARGV